MITLYTFGPMFGLPDPSPFVMKADMTLKLSGLPYRASAGNLRNAPKGKLPFIADDGKTVADSTLIRLHLEQRHSIDFDRSLSSTERGIAWSVEKMLEDHLYWAMLQVRWMDDANFAKGPANFFQPVPAPLRPLVRRMIRGTVRKALRAHGLGRHSASEVTALANRAIDSVAQVLGDKPYLMGAKACGADATVLAFVANLLCPLFESPIIEHARAKPNLVAYRDRLMKEFYGV
jgi:glutathione S-transferase